MATNLVGPTGDRGVFLKALPHIGHFAGRSSFSTWLTSIAINPALMILRKRRNSCEIPGGMLGIPGPLAGVRKSRTALRIRKSNLRAIRGLRPSSRGVLERQHVPNYSEEEIARMEGISVGAVKARLFHARMALRSAASLIDIAGSKFMARQTTTGSRTGDD